MVVESSTQVEPKKEGHPFPAGDEYLVDASVLVPHPRNPRGPITPEQDTTKELMGKIARHGQLVACLARPYEDGKKGIRQDGKLELIFGHRRRIAHLALGIPVRVRVEDIDDDAEAEAIMLSGFHDQENPDPLLESEAINGLLERPGWNLASVAEAMGQDPQWVARRANLRNLSAKVRQEARRAESPLAGWPIDWLEELAKLTPQSQDAFLLQDRKNHIESAKDLARALGEFFHVLKLAPWGLEDANLHPKAGACAQCPKTSKSAPGLFDDGAQEVDLKDATCRDTLCWARKRDLHVIQEANRLREQHPKLLLLLDFGDQFAPCPPELAKGAQEHYHFQPCEKSKAGARMGFFVSGQRQGKTMWVLPREGGAVSRDDAPARKATKKPLGKPAKELSPRERLKESSEKIKGRRAALLCDLISQEISKMKPWGVSAETNSREAGILAASLALAYGANPPDLGGKPLKPEKRKERFSMKPQEASRDLWERIQPLLLRDIDRKTVGRANGHETLDETLESAEWLGGLLGLDIKALKGQVEKEIPEPAWWAKALRGNTREAKSPTGKKAPQHAKTHASESAEKEKDDK